MPSCRKLFAHAVRFPWSFALESAARIKAARMPMMAITTRSSIKVSARTHRLRDRSGKKEIGIPTISTSQVYSPRTILSIVLPVRWQFILFAVDSGTSRFLRINLSPFPRLEGIVRPTQTAPSRDYAAKKSSDSHLNKWGGASSYDPQSDPPWVFPNCAPVACLSVRNPKSEVGNPHFPNFSFSQPSIAPSCCDNVS